MNFESFKKLVSENAEKLGVFVYELYYSHSSSQSYNAFSGEIDTVDSSSGEGVCFRCLVNGKIGYSSTELFSESEAHRLVKDAKESAEIIESDDEEFIFKGAEVYEKPLKIETEFLSATEHINTALSIEQICKNKDSRIHSVPYSMVTEGVGTTRIVNSYGLDLIDEGHMYGVLAQTTALQDEDVKSGFAVGFGRKVSDVSIETVCEEAVKSSVDTLGAKSVPSGKYKVVFSNLTMADMLSTFSGVFSASAAQKGMSLLKDKEGEKIASDIVTIIDDPRCEKSCVYSTFDAEGVPTFKKNVVENGTLLTFLHNLKTANKQGVQSTGNAYKSSYKSKVTVAPLAFYLKEGEDSLAEVIKKVENGLYITELSGLHAGADDISGDFSLAAAGFLIKDGKLDRPVNEITVAGNFFGMLKEINNIGCDLRFSMPHGGAQFGSPCVAVEKLTIAGE